MPALPGCDACPFRDDAAIACAAVATGHRRWCETVDPASPAYVPAMACRLVRTTLDLLGPAPAADAARAAILARRATKPRIRLGERPPEVPGRR